MLIFSVEDMQGLADKLATVLRCGDCLAIRGDLGAGKTTFVQRLIQELSEEEIGIISPTFNLLQTYDVTLLNGDNATLWHYDLYRLEEPEEIAELGLEDALDRGVTVIEWPEMVVDWMPEHYIDMVIEFGQAETNREVIFRGKGETAERLKRIGLC